jgi:pimeloyl-ACP methyl ester carboxylesterase
VGPKLPGPPVLILHGYTDNKSSYLDQAKFLFDRGYPSLLVDLRGHGESDSATVSIGPLESRDVVAVVESLQKQRKGERFIIWGISMGAAAALLAAAECRAIAGVLAESSYERLDQVVADTLWLRFRFPRFPVVPLALHLASYRSGVDFFHVSVSDAVANLGDRPVQVVSGGNDRRMPPELGERLLARARNGMPHLVIPEADHSECWSLGQPAYGESVLRLIKAAGRETSPANRI